MVLIFCFRAARAKNSCRSFRAAISKDSLDFAANAFTSALSATTRSFIAAAVLRTSFSSASLARPRSRWLKCATTSCQRCRPEIFLRAWRSAIESRPPETAMRIFCPRGSRRRNWISVSTRCRNSLTRQACSFLRRRASRPRGGIPPEIIARVSGEKSDPENELLPCR